MAKKKNTPPDEKPLEPAKVVVELTHVLTPHYLVLLPGEGNLITDAQILESTAGIPVGAKTVEQIVRETGSELPTTGTMVELTFSPHDGELIAASVRKATDKSE